MNNTKFEVEIINDLNLIDLLNQNETSFVKDLLLKIIELKKNDTNKKDND